MLTDSGDWHKEASLQQLRHIMTAEQRLPEEERLALHMIGFGPAVDIHFVEQLADIGGGSHIVCQTGGEVDRLDLVKAFSRLAAKPALKVSLMQELRGGNSSAARYGDLAAVPAPRRRQCCRLGPAENLQRCSHSQPRWLR